MADALIIASFLACALAYAALGLMLRPARYGAGAPRRRLRIAALATSLWALLALWATAADLLSAAPMNLAAAALIALWLWQCATFAEWQGQPRWFQQLLRWAGPVAVIVLTLLLTVPAVDPDLSMIATRALPYVGLLLAALGLLALEQMYRNATAASTSAVRWLCLGLGGIFGAELIGFAEAVLLGAVPAERWVARGVVYALCAVAIAQGARRMPDWSFGMAISRHVAFYTTSFFVIGGYLLLMSLGGWALQAMGGEWGQWAQVSFTVIGALVLFGLLFSDALRQRLRVFVSSHFYPQRYDYRREWLRFIRTLSEPDPQGGVSQRAIRAVAQIVESPRGVLWRRTEDGRQFEGLAHWPQMSASLPPVGADDALVDFLSRKHWLVDLREWRDRPSFYEELSIDSTRYAADPDALIVPLMLVDDLYGWLVLDRPPHMATLTFEDRDLLKTACRQIAVHLAQVDADAQLADARQFEAYSRMSAFVMHDLKNLAAQLKLISQNAERHKRNPEFVDDAMRTVGGSAARISKLITQLAGAADSGVILSGTMQSLDLAAIAERAAVRTGSDVPVPQVTARCRPIVFADMERLSSVIEHTIRNAQDATDPSGEVRIEVDHVDGRAVLRVIDTGCGMDASFQRERLFRPFDTTKGARGMGIGAFQVREYLRSLGGGVEVQSAMGAGTTFTMLFPVQVAELIARRAG